MKKRNRFYLGLALITAVFPLPLALSLGDATRMVACFGLILFNLILYWRSA